MAPDVAVLLAVKKRYLMVPLSFASFKAATLSQSK
jgi:hypothetical protein